MGELLINGEKAVKGSVTVSRRLDLTEETPKVYITGQLITHRYIEEIVRIDTIRFSIQGVTVLQEDFGSEDHQIVYTFVATYFEIPGETHLEQAEMEALESKLYGPDEEPHGYEEGDE